MTTARDIAHAHAERLDVHEDSALAIVCAHIAKVEARENRTIDEDNLSAEDAQFLAGSLAAEVRLASPEDKALRSLAGATAALATHDRHREHLLEVRNAAIRAAVEAGNSRKDIAATAAISRAMLYRILDEQ